MRTWRRSWLPIGSPMGNTKFSNILRDDLGLVAVQKKGYDLGELYSVVVDASERPRIYAGLNWERQSNGYELGELPSGKEAERCDWSE